MYLVDRKAPRAARGAVPAALPIPAQQVVLRRALRLPVRPSGLRHRPRALEGRRRRDHRRPRAGRRIGPRARRDPRRGAAAVRLRLSIRLRDAARGGRARDLVPVRGGPLMSSSWILSSLLILPLIGAAFILLLPGDIGGDQAQRALDRAVRHPHHLRPEPRRLGTFRPLAARLPADRGARLVLARHPLQARRRRRLDALRPADHLPDADQHRGLVDGSRSG